MEVNNGEGIALEDFGEQKLLVCSWTTWRVICEMQNTRSELWAVLKWKTRSCIPSRTSYKSIDWRVGSSSSSPSLFFHPHTSLFIHSPPILILISETAMNLISAYTEWHRNRHGTVVSRRRLNDQGNHHHKSITITSLDPNITCNLQITQRYPPQDQQQIEVDRQFMWSLTQMHTH